ncbi:MAG TPA: ABC transporter permease [Phycisphaerae bacterium]|nr:ABC transporter permease [Phycisphaerae bacterium]HNU44259.1 ABC transporter permease [Phycisphaerae bacterium]
MSALLRDLRYAVRSLAKRPGFAAVILVTLALGIGANTAVFSIMNGMLLRPLPYPQPDRLVGLFTANPTLAAAQPTEGWDRSNVSANDFMDWREQSDSFVEMGVCRYTSYNLTGADRPERVIAARASAGLLPALGFAPTIGRAFGPDEDRPGHDQVALLSDGFWQRRFGGDPGVVGRTILLDGVPYEVLGVLPAELTRAWGRFDHIWGHFDVWLPFAFAADGYDRGNRSFHAIGRLQPGVSVDEAETELKAIASRLAETYPESNAGYTVHVMPLLDSVVPAQARQALKMLTVAVGLVLLIACVNVANLLLARGQAQSREYAIRAALGAGRGRLVRQMLAECAVLSLAGGCLGVLAATWGVGVLVAQLGDVIPRLQEISVDGAALLFTLGLSCAAVLLFGLVPALRSGRVSLSEMFRDGPTPGSAGGVRGLQRDVFIVAQIAMALGLTVSAGLTLRSFLRLRAADPGLDARHTLTMCTQLPTERYGSRERRTAFFDQAVRKIRGLPGVAAAAAVSTLPGDGLDVWDYATVEDYVGRRPDKDVFLGYITITPGYFESMRIPVLTGRDFNELDGPDSPGVVIVNQALARRFWPDGSAVGKRLKYGARDSDNPWLTVVGAVGDVKQRGITRETRLETYRPSAQEPERRMTFVVRTAGEPLAATSSVRDAIGEVDPDQAVYSVRSMEEVLFSEARPGGVFAGMLTAFALIALTLASVGLYGTISLAVSRRTHEIGIRMAMGAGSAGVLRLVIQHALLLTGAGILTGIGLALLLGRALGVLLYGVSPTDSFTLVGAAVTLLAVGLIAGYVPARRATKVDPMVALRCE